MRALVQRVSHAAVTVDGERVSEIGPGMLVFVGIVPADTPEQAERLAAKLGRLRIFDDAEGRMNEPLGPREVLCVSQFSLYGDTSKGNRPSFAAAAAPQIAEPLYEQLCGALDAKRGTFGVRMSVELVNDGPVTLLLEV